MRPTGYVIASRMEGMRQVLIISFGRSACLEFVVVHRARCVSARNSADGSSRAPAQIEAQKDQDCVGLILAPTLGARRSRPSRAKTYVHDEEGGLSKRFHLAWFTNFTAGSWDATFSHGGSPWDGKFYVEFALALERACFDYIMLEDTLMVSEAYRGTAEATLKYGLQVPKHDPIPLAGMIAAATSRLGVVAVTSAMASPPFMRRAFAAKHAGSIIAPAYQLTGMQAYRDDVGAPAVKFGCAPTTSTYYFWTRRAREAA